MTSSVRNYVPLRRSREILCRRSRGFVACCTLFVSLALTACTPTYNWREIRPEGEGFAIMLPGRPATMKRTIDLDGLKVSMTMHGARVDATSFTVAIVPLPEDSDRSRARAIDAMLRGMLGNIGITDGARPTTMMRVPLADPGGTRVVAVEARAVHATGRHRGRDIDMVAVFVAHGSRAWQAVALGNGLPDEHSAFFVDSLRLIR